ncbi:MAG TPA: class I SAM-dependent methyltransferase [Bryobacteraceae bacterium]|nr:class I SAM-dependent methyltransferase [Bryobacteraceae bacterium]HPQ15290.1 class I SAM-dependent methyltransferase [Bryobacteraceae bacterium]HPU71408.1 class I SAM-dependent methyltransferase [Bryobacteraceae bacterium]
MLALGSNGLPKTIADRTRRIYDRLALIYPLSTYLFHSRAHQCALEAAGVRDGMRVLEVATGSGEMFRRVVRANPGGATIGVDLSPNMAHRTQCRIRREFPNSVTLCQAVDARFMPFRDNSFDVVFCCYLLELLGAEDIFKALSEIRRVLRPLGKIALVCIGQDTRIFNRLYKIAGGIAPAFWGRQVAHHVPSLIEASQFRVIQDKAVRQSFYPSRVLVATKVASA